MIRITGKILFNIARKNKIEFTSQQFCTCIRILKNYDIEVINEICIYVESYYKKMTIENFRKINNIKTYSELSDEMIDIITSVVLVS